MGTEKSLGLSDRFELSHPSLSHPGRLIPDKAGQALRLLSPIIFILFRNVDRLWNQFPVSNTITAQFVSHNLPRLAAMRAH